MSRSDGRSSRLRRRPSRTVPATIVAVVLTAAGVLAVVAAAYALTGGSWPEPVAATTTTVAGWTWGSAAVITVSVILLVIGIVLMIAAIKPGSHTSAQLAAPAASIAETTEVVISNQGLARLAATAAETVAGVEKVSASTNGRRLRIAVVTSTHEQAEQLRQRVQQSVTDRLRSSGVLPEPLVRTTVTTRRL